jgi:hypothetical protein
MAAYLQKSALARSCTCILAKSSNCLAYVAVFMLDAGHGMTCEYCKYNDAQLQVTAGILHVTCRLLKLAKSASKKLFSSLHPQKVCHV